ncbi:MAG: integration host factor subunit beta [Deltaproteobacteria bacterium]|nr:integration host factor subunit beta [Deltaproteobacteria bacterium]
MTKKDLVEKIRTRGTDFSKKDINFAVDAIFEGMRKTLSEGEKIEIRDFGVFGVTARRSRMGRNPKTGEEAYVPARYAVFFKTGKELKEMVNRRPDSYEI